MTEKTDSDYHILKSPGEGLLGNKPIRVCTGWPIHLLAWIVVSVILVFTRSAAAVVPTNPPILISESTSTRAIAVESLEFTREPFSLHHQYAGVPDERTRVMVFAMNLALQADENLSVVSADAEDATHRHYPLMVESIRPVPSCEWMSAVVLKLNDELGDVGDVLISISYRSAMSNRVRVGIGHVGGGLADDQGAVPTPAPPYTIRGQLTGSGGQALSGISLTLSGAQTGTLVTDNGGFYSFKIEKVGNYMLAPASNPYYTFAPQTFTNLHLNQVANFAGTLRSYAASGRLTLGSDPAPGVVLTITGSQTATATTNSNGEYSISLAAGGNYTITPSLISHDFLPASLVVTDLNSDQLNLNFNVTRKIFAISGRVLDPSGKGLIGISVSLSGAESATTRTAGDGSYSLTATATRNYTVTPSIPQDYYTFAPATGQFNNLAGAQALDFIARPAPFPNPSQVLEFNGAPKTVDYGNFWPEGVNLGHFYWEFWAMPAGNGGATYLLSDGYGGAHALLFGVGSFNTSEPNRYELLGNIFDGVRFDNYFGSDQGPAVGEWAHLAVGWNGENIITYYNGVPVGKAPFHGPRRTPGFVEGGGRLLIGGSDHSNFDGRIAQVRGYESINPRENLPGGVEASFAPQTVFGVEGNLLSYYFRSGGVDVADLSAGYNGVNHAGWARGTSAGILSDCGACPPPQFVVDPYAPNFAANTAPPPVSVATPPATPSGAIVFDSFSRANSTYLFGSRGGLGSTEAGSAGSQVWQTNQSLTNPQPFGILNSMAVLLANDAAIAWVPTRSSTGNLDVRVERRCGRWGRGIHTGLSFRVVDARNFFFAYTSDSGGALDTQKVRVGYYVDGQRVDLGTSAALPSNWTMLRVVTTDEGQVEVYADNTLVYSTDEPLMATATGAGIYNNSSGLGLVNRWDNFTVFNAP